MEIFMTEYDLESDNICASLLPTMFLFMCFAQEPNQSLPTLVVTPVSPQVSEAETVAVRGELKTALKRVEDLQAAISGDLNSSNSDGVRYCLFYSKRGGGTLQLLV